MVGRGWGETTSKMTSNVFINFLRAESKRKTHSRKDENRAARDSRDPFARATILDRGAGVGGGVV